MSVSAAADVSNVTGSPLSAWARVCVNIYVPYRLEVNESLYSNFEGRYA